MQPYHEFVFDTGKRTFVGRFEEMYQAEDKAGFDSWFERDLRPLRKQISLAVLNSYTFERILDVGCGKGAFTHLLKKQNNYVVGIDISEAALRKARESYPDVDFRCMEVGRLSALDDSFDLAVVMGTLAYVEGWPELLETLARITRRLYVAEYIPPDPIGFVKSSAELLEETEKNFEIQTKVTLDDEHILLLAESRHERPRPAKNS